MSIISVAVAMSVYKSDTVKNLKLSIDSILNQTYKYIDLFVEVDGSVSDELSNLLEFYNLKSNVNIHYNQENKGLASRLNQIIETVLEKDSYAYIARMDADDISECDRIEKQVKFLIDNQSVSVVGSDVIEIDNLGNEKFYKKMNSTHEELKNNIIKKCPFNHPSVLFRIDVFSKHGYRYKSHLMNTQDYYLWVDLLSGGLKFANINEPLLKFRVDDFFHHRRGLKKALNDVKSRFYAFKKLDVVTLGNLFHTFLLFILRVSPASVKSFAYKTLR